MAYINSRGNIDLMIPTTTQEETMIKWLSLLWVVTCVVLIPGQASAQLVEVSTKQTSSIQKNRIESLTVQRLPQVAVRIQEQSTFNSRKKFAIKAEEIFRKAGIKSDKMIIAMHANAWHESRWNPATKSGSCVGYFQLHMKYSGRGLSLSQLKNLECNVQKLMATSSFKDWVKWCQKNPQSSSGEMAFKFASQVLRCASKHRNARRTTANKWFLVLNSKKNSSVSRRGARIFNFENIATLSLQFLNTPYKWGGENLRKGIDCSAFVQQIYSRVGVKLPRTAAEQAKTGKKIQKISEMKFGDRVYFWDKKRNKIGHAGIYLGQTLFIHSSVNNRGVHIDSLDESNWRRTFVLARRSAPTRLVRGVAPKKLL